MVIDFDDIASIVEKRVIAVLDHTSLNDTVENPTCERVVEWIWSRLHGSLAGLDELVLWETPDSCAVYAATQ